MKQVKNSVLIAIIIVGVVMIGWLLQMPDMLRSDIITEGTVRVNDAVFNVEVADSIEERSKGLSGRAYMRQDEGMVFLFERPARYGFWMKDMEFALDIIWIANGVVVGYVEHAPPPSGENLEGVRQYAPQSPIDTVLEVNAGTVRTENIAVGDRVEIMIK